MWYLNLKKWSSVVIVIALLVVGGFLSQKSNLKADNLGTGDATILPLNPFTATSTPYSAYTTRSYGYDLYLPGSHVTTTEFSLLNGSGAGTQCAQFDNTGRLQGTGSACGAGGGGGASNWYAFGSDATILTPTTSAAGILVNSGTSTITFLKSDKATTTKLVVGTANPTINMIAGDFLSGRATTTSLTVTQLNAASCDLKADTSGNFYCGTDATGASAGAAWQAFGTPGTVIIPTTTNVGILVSGASSTIPFLNIPGTLQGAGVTTSWNTLYQATNTATWITLSNATTTQTNFQGQFNTALNSTSTLDLATLAVQTTLNLSGASVTNYFGTACTANNWLQDIADNGAFSCGALDVTGAWTGSFDGYQGAQLLPIIWNTYSNTISATNTSATFALGGSTTSTAKFIVSPEGNATTSGFLVVGTGQPTINMLAGDLLVARATTTSLAVTSLSAASCDVKATTNGAIYCGTDATGGSGSSIIWNTYGNTISATNTSATFALGGSTTSTAKFIVSPEGNATTSGFLVLGATSPLNNMAVGDALFGGSATTTGNLTVGVSGANMISLNATNGITFVGTAKPYRSIILTAGGAMPSVNDGGAATTSQVSVLYTTNRMSMIHLDFPDMTDNMAQWLVQLPDNYDGGTFTATIYSTATTTAGNVKWCIRGISYATTDALDGTWGTYACWGNQTIATANTMVVSTSTTVTISGTPVAGESALFELQRDVSEDNRVNYGRVLQVKLEYQIKQLSE